MAATRAPGRAGAAPGRSISNSKGGFSVPSHVRLARRAGENRRAALLRVAASSGRRDGWGADSSSSSSSDDGQLVDANMATLRRRIREARAWEEDGIDVDDYEVAEADAGGDLPLPEGWTELERRHHGDYVASVRGVVAVLEVLLLSARPGLGAGVLAILLLGVPASLFFVVCAQLMQTLESVSSRLPIGR
ncbi:hypothetical protein HU200_026739 [Digitaria exilis]|uniref:Uncharacterized protein n=1 Tax=Digitaria exilis TaxID=1010633 RepID=A0A835ERG2_9POAL|nr:hypothetical protein HU200_026739 [Digitaria exilis]